MNLLIRCKVNVNAVWKTIEHHKVMMKRSDYPDMVAGLQPFLRDDQIKIYHVEFNNDTDVAFTAPTTAISTLTTSEGQNREDLIVLFVMLGEKKNHGLVAWGEIQEEPGKYMIVAGNQVNSIVTSRILAKKFTCRFTRNLVGSYPRQ
jgi:hypothetical protein